MYLALFYRNTTCISARKHVKRMRFLAQHTFLQNGDPPDIIDNTFMFLNFT